MSESTDTDHDDEIVLNAEDPFIKVFRGARDAYSAIFHAPDSTNDQTARTLADLHALMNDLDTPTACAVADGLTKAGYTTSMRAPYRWWKLGGEVDAGPWTLALLHQIEVERSKQRRA